ncbi:MAG: FixH family protein [Magnetococcales bacterium]|nr:FixH family protein [Magnetococcales bacterium]
MMQPVTPDPSRKPVFRLEPWPTAIVLFFVVVVVVNLIFIRLSMTTWNGVVTEGAYDKGVAYNQVLKAQREQDALGWRVTVDESALRVGQEGTLQLSILDRQGSPVAGARVEGELTRPGQKELDRTFSMTEQRPGVYEARLHLSLPGLWDLKWRIDGAGGEYRLARRIQTQAAGLGG